MGKRKVLAKNQAGAEYNQTRRRRISDISSKERDYIKYLWRRTHEHSKYIQREEERLLSAKRLGLKECQRCGFCCITISCIPRPDEIETIAKFLGLTSTELVRKYMVIYKLTDSNYFLMWAKEGQDDITGTLLPYDRALDKSYCIFFDKETKVCKIYPVRPLEARDWNCWDVKPRYIEAASAWGRDDIYKFAPGFQAGG
jgi:Fe-S-cluster containining protein